MKVTRDDYRILRQILLRLLLYEAEAVWARDFLARIEKDVAASQAPPEPQADQEA